MKLSVRKECDDCWYVVDERGERYAQCGRWSTKEFAEQQAKEFLKKLGFSDDCLITE